jgi:transcriptional regulator NrdR family protein
MKKHIHLVKRQGHFEQFDENKLYKSCLSASLNAHHDKVVASKIAKRAVNKVKILIKGKTKINSKEIFKLTSKVLEDIDSDVAFLYETHRDIS